MPGRARCRLRNPLAPCSADGNTSRNGPRKTASARSLRHLPFLSLDLTPRLTLRVSFLTSRLLDLVVLVLCEGIGMELRHQR